MFQIPCMGDEKQAGKPRVLRSFPCPLPQPSFLCQPKRQARALGWFPNARLAAIVPAGGRPAISTGTLDLLEYPSITSPAEYSQPHLNDQQGG